MKYIYIFFIAIYGFAFLRAEVQVELSKTSINFGEIPYCKKITDTIVVKNSSTSTANLKLLVGERITGQDSKFFRITNPKIKDLDLPPYDGTNSVIYVVEFDASIQPFGDKSAKLLIPNDSKDTLIEIPIAAKSIVVDYEISPPIIDFQDISIGQDYYADLDITIKSNLNAIIGSVTWNKPSNLDVDISGSKELLSNTKRTFPIKIRLDKLGQFSGKIELRITEPCDTTFTIEVRANAPNGFIQGFRNIDLGLVSACETKEDNMELQFAGFGSGKIESIEIEGEGKENLAISFESGFPIIFPNNSSKSTCKVQYSGNSKNYGKKQITLKFNTEINSETKQYSITIDFEIAEVKLLSKLTSLVFPDTYPNQVSKLNFEISNPTQFDIQIDNIDLRIDKTAFTINPQNTPITLTKSDKQDFQFDFTPTLQNQDYSGTIAVLYSSHSCQDSLIIDISAKSLSKASLNLSFSDLISLDIDPKAKFLSIPISINTNDNEIIINDTLLFDIVFPRSVFYFDKIMSSNTTLSSSSLIDNERILSFRTILKDTKISTQKFVLGTIEGIPLLGDIATGEFAIKSYSFTSNSKSYDITSAKSLPFKIMTCNEGEPRLLNYSNQNKSIIEIKYFDNQNITIVYNAIESGINKIILYDIMGKYVYNDNIESKSGLSYNILLNIDNLLDGIYIMNIMTPSEIYTKNVLISK